MHSIKAHMRELKAPFVLIYLSLMGFLCIYSVQRYLHLRFEPMSCLSFMGIIFGVYTLNRFTDTAEDFTNDIGRLLFFQRKRSFLAIAILSLAASMGFLLWAEKLNWMHCLLLAMGFAYSYRVVPWFDRASGFQLLRIKEMTFLKNLSVSFLWGAAVFVVPIAYSGIVAFDHKMVWLLASGLFVSTFNNTLFDDILDEAGDRVAGIKTLPTTWGVRRSEFMLMALDLVWLGAVAALYSARHVDGAHALFLAFLGIYPFFYLVPHLRTKTNKGWIDLLAETDLLFFAVGMLLLSFR